MKRIISLLAVFSCLLTLSCKKEENGGNNNTPAQLGVEVVDAQALYEVAEHQTLTLEVAAVANPTSAEA